MTSTRFRPPYPLIGMGILVVAMGFGLPRIVPEHADTSAESLAVSKGKPFKLETASDPFVSPQPESAPNPVALMGRMILMAGVAGGVCIVVVKFMAGKATSPLGTMEVVASIRIDAKSMVYLVRAGERRLLLGTDQFGVKDMVELPGLAPEMEVVDPAIPTEAKIDEGTSVVGPLRSTVPTREQIVEFLTRRKAQPAVLSPRTEAESV